jgi:hypothetical protein
MSDELSAMVLLELGAVQSEAVGLIPPKDLRPFQVNADSIATGRTCIIGSSGSGKSYAVGVLCEELCKGAVPFALLDTEGEYSGLKDRFEALWIGEDPYCDMKWHEVDITKLARAAPDSPPLILDISETDSSHGKVDAFVSVLYDVLSNKRTPYLLIVEEADKFIPQSGGERLPIMNEVARRGRKRGLGMVVCTQRPSLVDKNVLSQCGNQLIGRLVLKNDMRAVEQFFTYKELLEQLPTLPAGSFLAMGGLSPTPVRVRIRERETRHGGTTPKLAGEPQQRAALEDVKRSVASGPASTEFQEEEALSQSKGVAGAESGRTRSVQPVREPAVSAEATSTGRSTMLAELEDDGSDKVELHRESSNNGGEKLGAILSPKKQELTGVHASEVQAGAVTQKVYGLPPLIAAPEAVSMVRRERSFFMFGKEETVASVHLVMRAVVELGISMRVRSALIRRKYETKYSYFDAVNGNAVSFEERFSSHDGMKRLIGLSATQVGILVALGSDDYTGTADIASRSNFTKESVRSGLRVLEEKRLVGSREVGRAKLYRRLVALPDVRLSERALYLENVDLSEAKVEEPKINEAKLEEVVKGLFEDATIESCKVFYYPLYRLELVLNGRVRTEWMDARTGKRIGS